MTESFGGHHNLPDWLADVPMPATERLYVEIDAGLVVPHDLLQEALELRVGSGVGAMSVEPNLGQLLAQFTEQAGWTQLPSQTTFIARVEEDCWDIKVGEANVGATRATILGWLGDASTENAAKEK